MAKESFSIQEVYSNNYRKVLAGLATLALALSGCSEKVSSQDAQTTPEQPATTVSETTSSENTESTDTEENDSEGFITSSEAEVGTIVNIVSPHNTDYNKGPVIEEVEQLPNGEVRVVIGACVANNYQQYTTVADANGDILSGDNWKSGGACSSMFGQEGISADYVEQNENPDPGYERPFRFPIFCMDNISDKTGIVLKGYTLGQTEKQELDSIMLLFARTTDNQYSALAAPSSGTCDEKVDMQRAVYE